MHLNPYTLITIGLIAIALSIVIYKLLSKKYLSQEQFNYYCKQINATSKLAPSHSLMESHKIMISSLSSMLRKKAKAANLLNKISSRIPCDKELWLYHRMRNTSAHEMNFTLSETDAKKARKVFKNVLKALTK